MSAYNDFLLGYLRKIDHWSIVGKGMSAYGDFLLDPAWFSLQNRSLVDFQERTKQNQADKQNRDGEQVWEPVAGRG